MPALPAFALCRAPAAGRALPDGKPGSRREAPLRARSRVDWARRRLRTGGDMNGRFRVLLLTIALAAALPLVGASATLAPAQPAKGCHHKCPPPPPPVTA